MTTAKKKTCIILALLLAAGFAAVLFRTCFVYWSFLSPNKSYFGDDYVQVLYPTGIRDYHIAKGVLDDAEAAFSCITTDAHAEEEFGKLARFCVTDEDAVSEQHAINLVSARFTRHTGYMWVSYYQTAYDKNHTVTSGNGGKSIGSQILSRWELSQDGGKWTVTAIREHP